VDKSEIELDLLFNETKQAEMKRNKTQQK
jgi:hypothetical protein